MKKKLSKVSTFHYFRLVFRGILLIIGIVCYVMFQIRSLQDGVDNIPMARPFLAVVWAIFAFEMICRFFPSRVESPGCQKQFAKNYIKTGKTEIVIADNHSTVLVALIWITMNGVIGAFKLSGFLNDGIMILICLFYAVCDMICILFFCPFQTWFLKNKCCSACRIYNWDYAMMFTPLFFVSGWYARSLLVLSVGLLFRWEITVARHPERFSENTNEFLHCKNCNEKLCSHKKQLIGFRKELAAFTKRRIEMLKK